VLVYGKTKVVWPKRGEKSIQVPVPESEWIKRELPEARIVTDALWKAAHDRIAKTRKAFAAHRNVDGQLQGRPESALVREHLLSGFLRCGVCNGNLFLLVQKGSKTHRRFYVCTTNFKRGAARCSNNIRIPYEQITQGVVDAFQTRLLDRAVIEKFLLDEQAATSPEAVAAERESLTADVKRLDQEIKRLIALADGDDDIEELKTRLQTKKAARASAQERLESLAARQGEEAPAVVFAKWFREWLHSTSPEAVWDDPKAPLREMLSSDIPEARKTLRDFLGGASVVVSPEQTEAGTTVSFRAEGDLAVLLGRLALLKASTARTSPGSRCPRSGARPPSSARGLDRGSCAPPRDRD
jgi:hypothetical protein